MFAIEVEFLTGAFRATAHDNRGEAEWPPHPARLYSAFVAALHDPVAPDPAERAALKWLAEQAAPSLRVDLTPGRRDVKTVFVPVNDVTVLGDIGDAVFEAKAALATAVTDGERKEAAKKVVKEEKGLATKLSAHKKFPTQSGIDIKAARALLPEQRERKARTFPTTPTEERAVFLWATDGQEHSSALSGLVARVARLGHSSSLVRCAVITDYPEPNLVPDRNGDVVLRHVAGPDQLERLEAHHALHQQLLPRVLPARGVRYREVRPQRDKRVVTPTVFSDEWVVFERIDGARLHLTKAHLLARAMHKALMKAHSGPANEILSGHTSAGEKGIGVHMAVVPLPHVGHEYADGSIQGVALILPRQLERSRRTELLRLVAALPTEVELFNGRVLPNTVFEHVDSPSKIALLSSTWCRPSTTFVSVTPVALDRYPGKLTSKSYVSSAKAWDEATRCIAASCARQSLPVLTSAELSFCAILAGSADAREFSASTRPGLPPRVRVHAQLVFKEPVSGPLLLGATRHFGGGLFRPTGEYLR